MTAIFDGTLRACDRHRSLRISPKQGEAGMSMAHPGVIRLLELIQAEYREMPGLRLKKPQMQRLWGLDPFVCDAVVDALVDARVLRRTLDGSYTTRGTAH
jgi:hypothetical protein